MPHVSLRLIPVVSLDRLSIKLIKLMEDYLQVRDALTKKIKVALVSDHVRSAPGILVGSSHVRPFIANPINHDMVAVPGGTIGHMISVFANKSLETLTAILSTLKETVDVRFTIMQFVVLQVLQMLSEVRASPPDVIVVVAGGNDIAQWRRTLRAHEWRKLRRIFCEEAVRAFPSSRIYLVDPLPRPGYFLRVMPCPLQHSIDDIIEHFYIYSLFCSDSQAPRFGGCCGRWGFSQHLPHKMLEIICLRTIWAAEIQAEAWPL